ncbi:hypothetical protein HRbin01_00600 [archaeon HR01]|nr:hypothetical protein HRbin01_00600 [archaeon HR01]
MSGVSVVVGLWFTAFIILEMVLMTSTFLETSISLPISSRIERALFFHVDIVGVNSNTVFAEIRNHSSKDVSVGMLNYSDLVVTYVDMAGSVEYELLRYSPNGEGPGWRIAGVKTGDYPAELLDPIDISTGMAGVWNIGETLVAELRLSRAPNASVPILAKLVVVT